MQMNKTLLALAAALAVLGSPAAQAQSSKELDELRQEIKQLREELNALKKQKAPEAKPADASGWGERIEALEIKSKDAVVLGDIGGGFRLPGSETSIRLYGYAEAHAIHDFNRSSPSDNFTDLTFQPTNADVAADPSLGQKGKTKFTAQTSRFGIDSSTPTSAGTFNTKIEADFYSYGSGNRNRLRLRHAYGEYAGWLVGQTWSTFMDLDDLPETVDFNGAIGAPFSRRTMVRYTWGDAKAGYKFTFAAEDPEDQFGAGSSHERMPELVARFDKSFDWGAINIRGLAHEKRSLTDTKRGYGLGIGGSFKLTDKDLLMAQLARVDGDIDQMYGSNGYAIDGTTGAITFDHNVGFVFGYNKTFSDQLRGTATYAMNRGKVDLTAIDPLNPGNRRLQQVFLNLIYSPIKNVELGAEYIWGQRKTFVDDKGTMSRFDLMGRYSF